MIETLEKLKTKETQEVSYDASLEQPEINNNIMELYSIYQEIQKLVDAIPTTNDVLFRYINEKVLKLDQRKNELSQLITSKREKRPSHLQEFEDITALDMEAKKEIAQSLIDKVNVYADSIGIIRRY